MILSFFYEITLWLLALVYLPKLMYDYFIRKKYKQNLASRLGFNFPVIKKGERKLVWVHAISMGETKAVTALIKAIREQLKDPIIVISNVTETGHAEAKRSLPMADYHVYLPLDLNFIIRPIIKRIAPDLVILAETDFWYNFLKSAKDSGAVIALVNGKISERSFNRFQKIPYFTKKLFSIFNLMCLQSNHYQKRFKALGIDESKMQITGNLKFDAECPCLSLEQYEEWKKQFEIGPEDQVVVVGSSHDPEEKLILEQFKSVWKELPHVKLMIVPRHPERFNEVAMLLEKENIPYKRFSQLNEEVKNARVILIDAMGLLRKCYQLADLAIVAGSYTPRVGGHNILEPSWYGVPVIYGPFMHSQPELVELMEEYQAGQQVPIGDLGEKILDLLKDPKKRAVIGGNGLRMLKDINGATQKTWESIKPCLETSKKSSTCT
jgi:3-deoxy-D-manno-octulosonic-acid transferase